MQLASCRLHTRSFSTLILHPHSRSFSFVHLIIRCLSWPCYYHKYYTPLGTECDCKYLCVHTLSTCAIYDIRTIAPLQRFSYAVFRISLPVRTLHFFMISSPMTGALLKVPIHALRCWFGEGRQAAAIASSWPSGQGHLNLCWSPNQWRTWGGLVTTQYVEIFYASIHLVTGLSSFSYIAVSRCEVLLIFQ